MSEWQDISTAPKDGSPFMFCIPDGRRGIAYIDPRSMDGVKFLSSMAVISGPDPWNEGRPSLAMARHYLEEATHWQPLPSPPEQ